MKRAILVIIFISLVGIVRADTVINDISGWKHPTKDIFKQNNVTIQNIKLQKNNTYPIFYIKLPDDSRLRHEAYFEEFLSDLATANSYWDFELVDQQKSFSVVVKIDKKNKRIQDAIYGKLTILSRTPLADLRITLFNLIVWFKKMRLYICYYMNGLKRMMDHFQH